MSTQPQGAQQNVLTPECNQWSRLLVAARAGGLHEHFHLFVVGGVGLHLAVTMLVL